MICDAHVHFFSPGFFDTLGALKGFPLDGRIDAVTRTLGWDAPESAAALADRWVAELDRHGVARAALIASVPADEAPVAAEPTVDVPLFIRADELVAVSASDRSYRDVQVDLRREVRRQVPTREVRQVALSGSSEGDERARQISSERLFGAIGAYPPPELARALAPNFFFGVYGSSKGPLPFLILEAENPDLARAAMLAWEETMADDLAPIFPEADDYLRAAAAEPTRQSAWVDTVYQNRDARALPQGDREVLLWGFGDNGAIIIASDPFLLPEMASRLARDRELH